MTLSISTQLQISLGLAKSHKRFTGTNRKFLLSLRTLPINLWHRITAAAKYHQLRSSQYTVLLDRIFPSLICQWETHFQTISKHICKVMTHAHAHAHAHTQPFNGLLSGTVRDYPGRPVPEEIFTHSHPSWSSDILYHLPPFTTIDDILFVQFTSWQSSRTTSLPVLFGLPLGLGPSTSYSMHFFTQSSSSFRSTCPYQRGLFCCNTNAMSSIPSLSLSCLHGSLSFNLTPHIHLTILISARWSATTFSFLTGQVSLPCNMLLLTQLLYNLPLIIRDTSLLQ